MDYYKTLGVEKSATEGDIKKAYRKFAHQYHPDSHGGGNEKKFKEVTEAYEVLSDKQKRAQYDQFGHAAKGSPGAGTNYGGFDFSGFQNVGFGFGGNFSDIFDNFFGGGGHRTQARKGPLKGDDMEVVIHLTFEEAVFGTTKEMEMARHEACGHCHGKGAEPGSEIVDCADCSGTGQEVRIRRTPLGQIQSVGTCKACRGSGRVPRKRCEKCKGEGRVLAESTIKIKIPEGIPDKATIRIPDKGEAGEQGGAYGDLFVHVDVAPSKTFERVKDDIHSTQTIHALQAILGDEVPIKTIHGEAVLKIPAGTPSEAVFRLKGKGVKRGNTQGDHLVKILVTMPQKLSKHERELYEMLAQETKLNIKPQGRGIFG